MSGYPNTVSEQEPYSMKKMKELSGRPQESIPNLTITNHLKMVYFSSIWSLLSSTYTRASDTVLDIHAIALKWLFLVSSASLPGQRRSTRTPCKAKPLICPLTLEASCQLWDFPSLVGTPSTHNLFLWASPFHSAYIHAQFSVAGKNGHKQIINLVLKYVSLHL